MAGVLALALSRHDGGQKLARRRDALAADLGKVTEPMTSSLRNFTPVLPSKPKAKVGRLAPVYPEGAPAEATVTPAKPVARSLSISASEPVPAKTGVSESRG